MSDLPKGWIIDSISNTFELTRDKGLTGVTPYLEIGNININNKKYSFTDKKSVKGCKKAIKGDVLISRVRPTRGAITQVKEKNLEVSSAFTILRNTYGFNERYLWYYLAWNNDYLNYLGSNCTGTMYPTVSESMAVNYQVPIAPLNEQRRIVAKLEKLLHKVEACKERLEKIPAIIKRFRQSVLATACSGRLTEDWREKNQSHNITEDSKLPIDWYWKTAEELFPKGGIFDGPFGSNLKTVDYTDSGVRVIRLENIGHLRFIGEKETYISKEKYKTLTRHTVGAGDIIFASFIEEEVRACVLPDLPTKAVAKADCFCLRPYSKLVDKRYLAFQLVSRESYDRLIDSVHGATRPRINTTQLRKLEIRMCPLPEQHEIVRRVEALFKKADEIEARYKKAKAFVDRLTQSILAKAFRGELVPQGTNDEPASVLLERIKVERTKQDPKRRGKRVDHDA